MQEMKEFTLGGNFIRIAAAFVLGLALERLVTQFVESWITPLLGIFGGKSFQDLAFTVRGSEFKYGLFLDAVISFRKYSYHYFKSGHPYCELTHENELSHDFFDNILPFGSSTSYVYTYLV